MKSEDEKLIFRARKAGADAERMSKLYRETGEMFRLETERMRRDHAALMKRVIPVLIGVTILIILLPIVNRWSTRAMERYIARMHEVRK